MKWPMWVNNAKSFVRLTNVSPQPGQDAAGTKEANGAAQV